jgi:general stress protein YciG
MADNTSNRGFASMNPKKREAAARTGGEHSGGQFKSGDKRTSEAGKRGAAAQPTEAKRLGGQHSHQND